MTNSTRKHDRDTASKLGGQYGHHAPAVARMDADQWSARAVQLARDGHPVQADAFRLRAARLVRVAERLEQREYDRT